MGFLGTRCMCEEWNTVKQGNTAGKPGKRSCFEPGTRWEPIVFVDKSTLNGRPNTNNLINYQWEGQLEYFTALRTFMRLDHLNMAWANLYFWGPYWRIILETCVCLCTCGCTCFHYLPIVPLCLPAAALGNENTFSVASSVKTCLNERLSTSESQWGFSKERIRKCINRMLFSLKRKKNPL